METVALIGAAWPCAKALVENPNPPHSYRHRPGVRYVAVLDVHDHPGAKLAVPSFNFYCCFSLKFQIALFIEPYMIP